MNSNSDLRGTSRRASIRRALVSVSAALLAPSVGFAQTLPDAGSVQQQVEGQLRSRLPAESAPQFLPPAPMESIGGQTMTVARFRFAGNELLKDDELAKAVAPFTAREIDFSGLQNAAIAVANAYRELGWIVRAYVPQQDIKDASVTIQIIEAIFGATRTEGGQATRISASQLRKAIERAQRVGEPLNANALDRGLLLINDLPGVSATGRLAAGADHAQTDLVLEVLDGPLVSGNLTADNAGSRFTGEERFVASASMNSRLGIGDRFDALLLHSEGNDYINLGYSMPIGSGGWRAGANIAHLNYEIVTSEFAALDAHGSSDTFGLQASYPLIRSRARNLYFTFNAGQSEFENESGSQVTTDYSVQSATVGLQGNVFDKFYGGGINTASLELVQGKVDLSGSPNELADSLTTRTAGSYQVWRLSASRLQMINERLSVYGNFVTQQANKNLDSSEKMYLGGSQGIRAYPENEAGGAEGMLLNLEARTALTTSTSLTGFIDWGRVQVNKNNNIAGAIARNNQTLKGAGVALGWTSSFGLTLKGTYSRRIGDNPNPTSNGDDQDGTLTKNRFWLQAGMAF